MRLRALLLGCVFMTLGVNGGCSSSDPEALQGACGGQQQCSLEALCAGPGCGGPLAPFDEAGCQRARCLSSSDCGEGEICFLPSLIQSTCLSSGVSCQLRDDGTCMCGGTTDCGAAGICVQPKDIPEEACVAPGDCKSLRDRLDELQGTVDWGAEGDLLERIGACKQKMYDKQAELSCAGSARARQGGFD